MTFGGLVAAMAIATSAMTAGASAMPGPSTTAKSSTTTTGAPTNAAPATSGRYQQFGDAGGFLNIVAPGQYGNLTTAQLAQVQAAVAKNDPSLLPAHYGDQRTLYNNLVHAKTLTNADLTNYFKDASFGVKDTDIASVYHPANNNDVTVIRDKSFGVPHIYGRTRDATVFAEGYTTAEDRLVYLDVLRHVGRGTLSELVGAQIGESQDASTLSQSPYTEADFRAQLDALRTQSPDGAAVYNDVQAYAAGVNAYLAYLKAHPALMPAEYKALGTTPQPWTMTDTVAIGADVGGIFGKGGGSELNNACGLQKMTTTLGSAAAARTVFNEIHFANDAGAPTTVVGQSFPYEDNLGPADPAAVPSIDCSSLVKVGGGAAPTTGGLGGDAPGLKLTPRVESFLTDLAKARTSGAAGGATPTEMSNAILIGASHTDNGRPIAVFGPQVGYNEPALLVEKDVHGPGIDARGVSFLGTDMWVQLGRGTDYAWSATSSGADNIDTFVLKLCDPAGGAATVTSTGYLHDGVCKAIETFDHVENTRAGVAADSAPTTLTWHIQRAPDYGPITNRGTLTDGTPIAIAVDRSTYGRELSSGIGFKQLNDPDFMASGVKAFDTAAGANIDYTFNWFYVDSSNIAYQHSCRCPIRAKGVDPDLPTLGVGLWDWKGWLPLEEQPHIANPQQGYLTSWNNKQAPGFRAADDEWSDGPVQRVQLLNSRVDAAFKTDKKLNRADVVLLMDDAATADLRGEEILPDLLAILKGTPPAGSDPRVLDMRETLEIWLDHGAHRLDLNGTGKYDDPVGPAIMDTWWDVLTRTTYAAPTGNAYAAIGLTMDNSPREHGGSSFLDGEYSLVRNDLDQLLGKTVASPYAHPFCGADLTACRTALWTSLATAAQVLAAPRPAADGLYPATDSFGTPTVESWTRVPADDEIRFDALIAGQLPMEWVNRPTFQQVVQLETATRVRPAETVTAHKSSNDSHVVLIVVVLIAVGGVAFFVVRRRRRHRFRRIG
jgi:acyl-homoserine lactone acylase PvdQ